MGVVLRAQQVRIAVVVVPGLILDQLLPHAHVCVALAVVVAQLGASAAAGAPAAAVWLDRHRLALELVELKRAAPPDGRKARGARAVTPVGRSRVVVVAHRDEAADERAAIAQMPAAAD
jgi:hypothetical protein